MHEGARGPGRRRSLGRLACCLPPRPPHQPGPPTSFHAAGSGWRQTRGQGSPSGASFPVTLRGLETKPTGSVPKSESAPQLLPVEKEQEPALSHRRGELSTGRAGEPAPERRQQTCARHGTNQDRDSPPRGTHSKGQASFRRLGGYKASQLMRAAGTGALEGGPGRQAATAQSGGRDRRFSGSLAASHCASTA